MYVCICHQKKVAFRVLSYSFERREFDRYEVHQYSAASPVFPPASFSIDQFESTCKTKSVLMLLDGYDVNDSNFCQLLNNLSRFHSAKNLRIVVTSTRVPSAYGDFPSTVKTKR
jgi:hypothetical protein